MKETRPEDAPQTPGEGERREPLAEDSGGDPASGVPVGLLVAFLLSALAGAVDAYGLAKLKDIFVSFMSGNTTMMGVAFAAGDVSRGLRIAALIVLFVAGAAAGTVIASVAGRHRLPIVTATVGAILVVAIVVPAVSTFVMAAAMGLLNAAMKRAGTLSVSITYVTGTLVHLGQGLGDLVCGRDVGRGWYLQAVPWLGIVAGATAAAVVLRAYGIASMPGLPIAAFVVTLFVWLVERVARLDRIVVTT